MKRLCVIGTSHIGALKTGWDEIRANHSDWDIVFFGAPNVGIKERLDSVRPLGAKLVSDDKFTRQYFELTSEGKPEIDLTSYDCFLIQGAGIAITPMMRAIYLSFRSERHALPGGVALVSEACFSNAVKGTFLSSVAVRLANDISNVVDTPVYLMPGPYPSEGLLKAEHSSKEIWKKVIQSWQAIYQADDHLILKEQYQEGLEAVRKEGIHLMDIPAELESIPCFTPHKYCSGGEWLQDGKYEVTPEDDFFHMNSKYGAALLNAFFKRA